MDSYRNPSRSGSGSLLLALAVPVFPAACLPLPLSPRGDATGGRLRVQGGRNL